LRVLVLNAGSSSLKASILETGDLQTLGRTEVALGADAARTRSWRRHLHAALETLGRQVPLDSVEAVGHRVVHGGSRFRSAVRIDPDVLAGIDALRAFAPLHNHLAAETIRMARSALPAIPHVAAFDSAFHAALPPEGFLYPLPYAWYRDWGIRRFGFHGLSVAWALERAASLLGRSPTALALVVAHLGSGCSVTAVLNGRSVETSMGLTPMEGLMMGTRAGSIDPGVLLFVLRTRRAGRRALEDQLDHHSGLVGVSGRAAGLREIEAAAAAGDERARLAVDLFVRRAAAGIAAAATTLPRLDGLVFTGGIGEHSAAVRAAIASRLSLLGLSAIREDPVTEDSVLSRPGAAVGVLRIESREDVVVARQAEALIQRERP